MIDSLPLINFKSYFYFIFKGRTSSRSSRKPYTSSAQFFASPISNGYDQQTNRRGSNNDDITKQNHTTLEQHVAASNKTSKRKPLLFLNKEPVNNNTTTQYQEDTKSLSERTQAISLSNNGKEELKNAEKSKWEKFLPPIK